jgi:hypothetical protein
MAVQDHGLVVEQPEAVFALHGAYVTGTSIGVAATVGASLTLTDLVVEDTTARGTGDEGLAVLAVEGASVTVERARLSRTRYVATAVTTDSHLDLTDVRIEDVAPRDEALMYGPGRFGRALGMIGGSARLSRVDVARAHELAIAVMVGGALEASDLRITETLPRACAADACAGEPGGVGLGVYHGSTASLERFDIGHSALAAVQITEGELDLRDGVIHDNPIGLNVQIADYDLSRLSSGVRFERNGTNLDSQDLPVPDVATE